MKSPLNYLGGKSRLAKYIVPLIPPHLCYCEPFSGAAWVMFAKEPSQVEVINDLDCELVTFWRVIQRHLEEFLRYYKFAVVSRTIFDLEKRRDPTTLTDIERAVRYYYLQRLAFGGHTTGRSFGSGPTRPANLILSSLEEVLLNVHWRIKRWTIENLDACECIRRYDRPTTFFYIDPPYCGLSGYAIPFGDQDLARLQKTLRGLKGKFILSLNDIPAVRRLFSGFHFKRITTLYSSGNNRVAEGTRSKPRFELLIHNLRA